MIDTLVFSGGGMKIVFFLLYAVWFFWLKKTSGDFKVNVFDLNITFFSNKISLVPIKLAPFALIDISSSLPFIVKFGFLISKEYSSLVMFNGLLLKGFCPRVKKIITTKLIIKKIISINFLLINSKLFNLCA